MQPPHKKYRVGSSILHIEDEKKIENWICVGKSDEGYYLAQRNRF